ncbi:MAG: sigma-54 dependent transcriptional regulator [bacterium]
MSEAGTSRKSILVVDDRENVRKMLAAHLSGQGYEAEAVSSGEEAMGAFQRKIFDVVITDMRMPGMDGLAVIRTVKEISPDTVVVVITAYAEMDNAIEAMKEGAFDYIKKPFKLEEIDATISKALKTAGLLRENRLLREAVQWKYSFSRIVARSKPMRGVFDVIERVARTDSTVLILGETGVGKELVARAIHFNSRRRNNPFVAVDCAAIPHALLESELFGHVRGAFTGAVATQKGMFEAASGGTLFLDEIGELDLSLQAKLLRALEEGVIMRVGDTVPRKVDVRLLAATNKEIAGEVEAGRFRKDLYFRINVVPVTIPPLRERKEDVPILARHFCETNAEESGKPARNFSPDALDALINHSWPGNVRELQNVVERCILMSDAEAITLADLPPEISGRPAGGAEEQAAPLPASGGTLPLKERISRVVEEMEKDAIKRALMQTGNRRQEAADLLGISRRSLFYKIKEYGL